MSDPILIGVGSTEAQMLPLRVLAWTLRKHTRRELEIVPLWQARIPVPLPKDRENQPRTPFTFQRFLLPELGGFARKSIYLDSDMIVFRDIGELYDTPLDGADVLGCEGTPGRRAVFSVLLIGESTRWRVSEIVDALDRGALTYDALMYDFQVPGRMVPRLSFRWNSCELYEPGETRLLHYTDMWKQPWLVRSNPLAELWVRELCEAVEAGAIEIAFLEQCVARRWIRPSLVYQVRRGITDPARLPLRVKLGDLSFDRYARRQEYRIF